MKRIMVLSLALGLCLVSGALRAQEQAETIAAPAAEASTAVEVGNKICPVSGDKVGEMGDAVKVEHKGKIYSLCCGMCKGDFTKDPDKYSKIADDEVAAVLQ